jgi:hypothetical protein
MEPIGKVLVVAGLGLAVIGGLIWLGVLRWLRLGRLPGDVAVERDGFAFYFPITTMHLLSALLMLVSWIVGALRR